MSSVLDRHLAVKARAQDPRWTVLDGEVPLQFLPAEDYIVIYPITPVGEITRVAGEVDLLTHSWNTVVVSRTATGCLSLAADVEERFSGWRSPFGRAVQIGPAGPVLKDDAIVSGARYSLTFEHRIRNQRGA